MHIKHILILNTGIGVKDDDGNFERGYEVRVNLSHIPEKIWMRCFLNGWKKQFIDKAKKIRLSDNELSLLLLKGDNIQKYISAIKYFISKTDSIVLHSHIDNLDRRKFKAAK